MLHLVLLGLCWLKSLVYQLTWYILERNALVQLLAKLLFLELNQLDGNGWMCILRINLVPLLGSKNRKQSLLGTKQDQRLGWTFSFLVLISAWLGHFNKSIQHQCLVGNDQVYIQSLLFIPFVLVFCSRLKLRDQVFRCMSCHSFLFIWIFFFQVFHLYRSTDQIQLVILSSHLITRWYYHQLTDEIVSSQTTSQTTSTEPGSRALWTHDLFILHFLLHQLWPTDGPLYVSPPLSPRNKLNALAYTRNDKPTQAKFDVVPYLIPMLSKKVYFHFPN